nr:MAG TPA: Membrane fusion protein Use1 [Caudoviricetes sp.]
MLEQYYDRAVMLLSIAIYIILFIGMVIHLRIFI